MRIDSLTIENFNGFAHRTFRFNPHFNLLVGDNATGKTSVLDALAIAMGSWFLGLRGYEKSPGIAGSDVRVAAHRHPDSLTFEKQFPSRIECAGMVMDRAIRWARELPREGGRTTALEAKGISDVAAEAERLVRTGADVTLPLICAYGAERLWFEKAHKARKVAADELRGKPSRFNGYLDCLEFTIQETALLNWMRDETLASSPRGDDTISLRAVKRAIMSCVEGAESIDYDGRYKDLVVQIEGQGPQLFGNLSDGQRIMLTLVGDLARRAVVLNPHLGANGLRETRGVVTIDELDLHLHPQVATPRYWRP